MTKTDWTAEEVRAQAKLERRDRGDVVTEAMLTAFAERIAADEGAVPAAYMWEQFYQHENEGQAKWHTALADFPDYEERDPEEVRNIQPLFTHPPAQETPCSLNEALNVIEHWGRRGNTLNGDDVDRFRALADKIAPAQEQPGWKWVPVEPTEAMLEAALKLQGDDAFLARAPAVLSAFMKIYKAMLAASPTPPKEH